MSLTKKFSEARIKTVSFMDDFLSLSLTDARQLMVPLAYFPRLLDATPAQRENYRLIGAGIGIHWPDLDEDISLAGLLAGPTAA
jgi:hypothetical protein